MAQHTFTTTGVVITQPTYNQVAEDNGVCKFRMKSSRSVRDGDSWKEYDTLWIQVECWGKLAENVRRSVEKMMHVIVAGTMVTHEFQGENNEKRSYTVLKANYVGPDLNRYIAGTRLNVAATTMGETELAESDGENTELKPWIDTSCVDERYNERHNQLEQKEEEVRALRQANAEESVAAL